MSERNRIKDFAPRVIGGAVALLIATLVGLTFWPDMPKVPTRQPVSTFESQFAILRPDCLAAGIAALPSDARAAKKAECDKEAYAARQTHRDALQSIRATNASEDGLWLAYQQAQVGIIQAILTVMALLATAWAAWAAADAARAAERSLNHADDVMRNDLRAYVNVSQININWKEEGAEAVLTVANCGGTPATYFTVMGVLEYLPLMAEPPIKDRYDNQTTWSALAANAATTAPLRQEGVLLKNLSRTQDNYLSVRGVIEYGTIFKETCSSQFSFMLKYRPEKLQKMQVNTGRLDVFRVVSRETQEDKRHQRADHFTPPFGW